MSYLSKIKNHPYFAPIATGALGTFTFTVLYSSMENQIRCAIDESPLVQGTTLMLKERIENNKERLSLVADQISIDRERDFRKFENKMTDALDRLEKKIATDRKKDFEKLEAKMGSRLNELQDSIIKALNQK
jgi:hypothetical protein